MSKQNIVAGTQKLPDPRSHGEKWMLFVFPTITLTLFFIGIILLWAVNTFVAPIL